MLYWNVGTTPCFQKALQLFPHLNSFLHFCAREMLCWTAMCLFPGKKWKQLVNRWTNLKTAENCWSRIFVQASSFSMRFRVSHIDILIHMPSGSSSELVCEFDTEISLQSLPENLVLSNWNKESYCVVLT